MSYTITIAIMRRDLGIARRTRPWRRIHGQGNFLVSFSSSLLSSPLYTKRYVTYPSI